jgi:hypothetical protein
VPASTVKCAQFVVKVKRVPKKDSREARPEEGQQGPVLRPERRLGRPERHAFRALCDGRVDCHRPHWRLRR